MVDITRTKRRGRIVLLFITVALLLGLLGAYGIWEYGRNYQWWGETDQLRTLKASPLANEQLVGYPIVHTEQPKPVGIMGKRGGDRYLVWYDPSGKDPIQVRDEIVAFAEQNGFSRDAGTSTAQYTNLISREQSPSVLIASIQVVQQDDNPVQPDLIGSVLVKLYYQ